MLAVTQSKCYMYNFQIHTEVEELWVDTVIYLSWEKLLLLVVDCSCMCLLSVRCHTVFTLLIPLFQSRTHYSVHPQITRFQEVER